MLTLKKIIPVLLLSISICSQAQDSSFLNSLKDKLIPLFITEDGIDISKTKFKTVANTILNDPEIYNEIWNKVNNSLRGENDRLLIKNLNLKFKTFQANDSNKTSLGFEYKWNYDINKNKNTDYEDAEFLAKIVANGNIAFKKNLNAADFQNVKIELGRNAFLGGPSGKRTISVKKIVDSINQILAAIDDEKELEASPLWNTITNAIGIKNQYHYNFSANAGWEGTQDFSKSQYTYGLQIRLGAKSYSDKNILSQLNILDYPFALIRYITGSDRSLTPYGASLPLITIGIDQVNPTKDSARKELTGDEKKYARFKFEAGFRTLLINIKETPVHFNAAYRFFSEISPPTIIKTNKLNKSSYFTFSVTSGDMYFISYSYGRLPFDKTDNAIYEMGFKMNL
jgi:hypothetical protein